MTDSPDAVPYLLLGRSLPDRSVSLDILIDSFPPPVWVARAIELLARTPHIELRRVAEVPSERVTAPDRSVLFRTYESTSLERCDFLQPAKQFSIASTQLIRADPFWEDALRADPSDVVLYLGSHPLKGECAGLARGSIWSFAFGDPVKGESGFFFARDIMGPSTVLDLCLLQHSTRWSHARILHSFYARKQQSLFYLNAAKEALAAAGALVARYLHDLLEFGPKAISGAEIEIRENQPSVATLVQYLAGRPLHSLLARTLYRGRRKQWFVAWRDNTTLFTINHKTFQSAGFRDFRGRAGMGYADPFPFAWEDKNLVFIEEILPDQRGRLVVTEVCNGQASPDEPAVILDKPYHLSYPFVFEHEGEYYMIPETAKNRTVELYRAKRFPLDWVLHKNLIEGLGFVDTTPVFHNGLWYFFLTTADPKAVGAESFLYYSDRLDGPWVYHPSNPISSDARRNRAAGRLFRWGDRLIRPVQDCSLDYGMAIRLMAIEKFTPEEYSEREVATIDCAWHPEAIRTHTLNSSRLLEAIDGSRWVR